MGSTPAELGKTLRDEVQVYKKIVADALAITAKENDTDATAQINKWAAAKVASAKKVRPEISEMATA